jgi:protein-disulfide isomerase
LPATFDLTGAQFKGSQTSPIVLVEFSDYECPFCIRHFTQVMPQLEADYIKTAKIRYTFRDFPIDQLHPESIRAHVAAHCATEQGKFWDMHNRLFSAAGTHQPANLLQRAKDAGLNPAQFSACVATDKYSTTIRQSTAQAIGMGAEGTPFFLIGVMDGANQMKPVGKLPGAMPYQQFQAALDAAIAGKQQ